MNVVVNLVLQVLFLSQTLKNVLLGCSGNAARCNWGNVAVMVWLEVVVISECGKG